MTRITYCFLALLLFAFSNTGLAQGIVINEVLSSNTEVNVDEDGTYQDWVELYNAGAVAVNLNGYGLTDDATAPFKWTFPNVTVAPGAYLLVWCSDKNRIIPGSPLHTNWKIGAAGETITLTNAGSATVDAAPAANLAQNMSWGRLPNGTGPFVFFTAVTPNAVNSTQGYTGILEPPTFSQDGGFLTAGFALTISSTTPGSTILYTLDGSEPSETNLGGTTYQYKNQYAEHPGDVSGPILTKSYQTLTYTAPINIVDRSAQPNKIASISTTFNFNPTYIPEGPIFKGTIVRAKVIKTGALSSPIVTKTYFVTPQGSGKFSIPVVSISINEDRLFDYEDGIQVAGIDFDEWRAENPTEEPAYMAVGNFYRRGAENEKVGNFNYFVNGVEVVNQDVGIRSRGGGSCEYPSKAMNLYARSELGDGNLSYRFFNDLQDDKFDRLMLRNGGGDFYGTMFRDAMNHVLVKELHCETESYQPAVTFINGEYWGILDIREKYDNNYFKRVFDIDDIDMLEDDGESVEEGDSDDYLTLRTYMENNSVASDANYDYVKTRMDPESFADYYIANIYFDNTDWPGTNVTFWRKKTEGFVPNAPYGHDGRWRWAFHDMDDTFSIGSNGPNHNNLASATATNGPDWPNPEWSTLFLRKLLQNNSFKNDFINRFADLMNTSFLSTRVLATMNTLKDAIALEMPGHVARWETLEDIDDDLLYYYNRYTNFANQRPDFQRNHIRNKFSIANNINATLDVSAAEHGFIKMNTIDVKDGTPGITGNPYPWTGIYFSNIPVKLKAVANDGFVFSHWEGASTSTDVEITINSASNFAVKAIFVETVVNTPEPVYFWMMNGAIPNDTPLTFLNSTFEANGTDAVIDYQSCLVGYPFTSASPNWRKASMERRNAPTPINYIPEANGNAPYVPGDMKALQIVQPFQSGGLENTMVFNISTAGYEDIKFAFAAKNENAADAIVIDYSTVAGAPVWQTAGITSSMPLTAEFQLFNTDFSAIAAADNNANFKVRLRFTGADMTADLGNRVTFNNISMVGTEMQLGNVGHTASRFVVYPNPFSDILNISGIANDATYKIYTVEGKIVKSGSLTQEAQISLGDLTKGMYLMQLVSEGKTETKKILKR